MPSIEPVKQAAEPAGTGGAARTILFLTVFIDLLGFGIVIPFLPMFAKNLGVGAFGVGLIMAIYSLMQLIVAPVLGRISDRVGRKPVIMLGLLGSSAGYAIYGFAGSFVALLASRALHGACAGTISTAQAYVADTTDDKNRARGMGMIGAAFGLGFVLGPALGGLLGQWGLRTPVFFAAGLTLGNFVFAGIRLPESHHPDKSQPLERGGIIEPLLALPRELTRHRLTRLFGIAFLVTSAIAALETTFALTAAAVYGYGAVGVGMTLAFAGVVQAVTQGYLLGKVVKRVGEQSLVKWGALALAVGLAPLGTLASPFAMLALMAILSLGYGLASPSIASLISRNTAGHLQGEVLGVNQSAMSLARICGPIMGGLLYQAIGPAAPYISGAAIAVVALAMAGKIDTGNLQEEGARQCSA
ncbi:MAG TPA: MFS transporter [Candidatus Binataceae bacterium]|nr:MFS transporter [Candidatus Binataceae bacterium]